MVARALSSEKMSSAASSMRSKGKGMMGTLIGKTMRCVLRMGAPGH